MAVGRIPSVHWSRQARAWRSDVGPWGKTGRRRPVYFRADADGPLENTPRDRRRADFLLSEYLRSRDKAEAEARIWATDPTAGQVAQLYLAACEAKVDRGKMTARNQRDLEGMLSLFLGYTPPGLRSYQDRHASELKAIDLVRVMRRLETATHDLRGRPLADGYSPHYIVRFVASVKACWAWAAAAEPERKPERLIPANPFADVKGPGLPDAQERYVSPAQAEAMLAFIDSRAAGKPGVSGEMERLTALCIRLIYASGCRPSEAVRAKWSDFYPEQRVIVLAKDRVTRQWRHKTGAKTRRPRRIPLTAELIAGMLAERERPGRHPEYVFTHRRGKNAEARGAMTAAAGEPWTADGLGHKFRILRDEAEAAGLDVMVRDGSDIVPDENPRMTLYDFRRSFSTDAFEADIRPEHAANAQGHSTRVAETIYRARRAKAVADVGDAVAKHRSLSLQRDGAV